MLNLFDDILPETLVSTPQKVERARKKAKARASIDIYNKEKGYSLQMTPEVGSGTDQMKDLYGTR